MAYAPTGGAGGPDRSRAACIACSPGDGRLVQHSQRATKRRSARNRDRSAAVSQCETPPPCCDSCGCRRGRGDRLAGIAQRAPRWGAPGPSDLTNSAMTTPLVLDLVDARAFWVVPLSPAALLAYISSHAPTGWHVVSLGSVAPNFGEILALPPVPGRLDPRQINIVAVALRSRRTALRVDAQVVWLRPRLPGSLVPPSSGVVTVEVAPPTVINGRTPGIPIPAARGHQPGRGQRPGERGRRPRDRPVSGRGQLPRGRWHDLCVADVSRGAPRAGARPCKSGSVWMRRWMGAPNRKFFGV